MPNQRKTIAVHLTKNDNEIARWFNMVVKHGESVNLWISTLLLAAALKKPLLTGSVEPAFFFEESTKKRRQSKNTTAYRDSDGLYIPGSVVMAHTSDPNVLRAIDVISERGQGISTTIKAKIREGLRHDEMDWIMNQQSLTECYLALQDYFSQNDPNFDVIIDCADDDFNAKHDGS